MAVDGRFQHKHETEAHWKLAVNFVPLNGELIIYDIDETYSYERFKIGDGKTKVNDLSFTIEKFINETYESTEFRGKDGYTPIKGIDYWTPEDQAAIRAYIDASIIRALEQTTAIDGLRITAPSEEIIIIDGTKISLEEAISEYFDAGNIAINGGN